ncbi:hypothetical protein Arad_1318 [Rhizobium rhizogenes K84]|uniref:Uncharacterized protein n=1 Tax=Rhizobium rhizogenes (strain K84 / ATCC BAA-868) TaxID=311403 RepID=B9JAV2_RHIR8|nr:hypothetical protein Arad_1318 [Rhizobium rhizogenes K84]
MPGGEGFLYSGIFADPMTGRRRWWTRHVGRFLLSHADNPYREKAAGFLPPP